MVRRNELRLYVGVVQDIPISIIFGRDAIHCVFTIGCNKFPKGLYTID